MCVHKYGRSPHTSNLVSFMEIYGLKSSFRFRAPSSSDLVFIMSKNLSNILQNIAVSLASSPTKCVIATDTDVLSTCEQLNDCHSKCTSTCMSTCIFKLIVLYIRTCAARSTRIFE